MELAERIIVEQMDDHSARVTVYGLGTVLVFIDPGNPGDTREGLRVVIDPEEGVKVAVDQ